MPLPSPEFVRVHGLLQFPTLLPPDPGRDERLIAALAKAFPYVVARQYLPAGSPANTPHLVLTSSSSQLAISAVQADFEVRFYGPYTGDVERCLGYVADKLSTLRQALAELGVDAVTLGIVATVNLPFAAEETETPSGYILRQHLAVGVDPLRVQDASLRIAVRVRDVYFVTLSLSNYESRVIERPMLPGPQAVRVRSGEGRLLSEGLELTVDVNNNLEVRMTEQDPIVSEQGLKASLRLVGEVVRGEGLRFAETGQVSVEALERASNHRSDL